MSARLCCSYLRVYQPLESLSDVERAMVERARAKPGARTSRLGLHRARGVLRGLREDRRRRVVLSVRHTPRLRWLLGSSRSSVRCPNAVPAVLHRRGARRDARSELETLEREHPGIRPPIVQSLWHVPRSGSSASTTRSAGSSKPVTTRRIRYETTMTAARERVDRALGHVTGGIVHPGDRRCDLRAEGVAQGLLGRRAFSSSTTRASRHSSRATTSPTTTRQPTSGARSPRSVKATG